MVLVTVSLIILFFILFIIYFLCIDSLAVDSGKRCDDKAKKYDIY